MLVRAKKRLSRLRQRSLRRPWRLDAALYSATSWRNTQKLLSRLNDFRTEEPVEFHGLRSGAYAVCPTYLSSSSIVYSFGIGSDNSFERSLIKQYNLSVYAFDPTNESALYLRQKQQPAGFRFQQCALTATDQTVVLRTLKEKHRFYRPATVLRVRKRINETIEVEGRTLHSLLDTLEHTFVDVLKMDIEGAEYDVLESLLKTGLPTKQLVLELHPGLVNLTRWPLMLGPWGWRRTESLIRQLGESGFRLFHVSERGTEFSFVRTETGTAPTRVCPAAHAKHNSEETRAT